MRALSSTHWGFVTTGIKRIFAVSIVIWEAAAQDSAQTSVVFWGGNEKRHFEMFRSLVDTESCPSTYRAAGAPTSQVSDSVRTQTDVYKINSVPL